MKRDTSDLRKMLRDKWHDQNAEFPYQAQRPIGHPSTQAVNASFDFLCIPISDATAYWGFRSEEEFEQFLRDCTSHMTYGVPPGPIEEPT